MICRGVSQTGAPFSMLQREVPCRSSVCFLLYVSLYVQTTQQHEPEAWKFVLRDLEPGLLYSVRVFAINEFGNSSAGILVELDGTSCSSFPFHVCFCRYVVQFLPLPCLFLSVRCAVPSPSMSVFVGTSCSSFPFHVCFCRYVVQFLPLPCLFLSVRRAVPPLPCLFLSVRRAVPPPSMSVFVGTSCSSSPFHFCFCRYVVQFLPLPCLFLSVRRAVPSPSMSVFVGTSCSSFPFHVCFCRYVVQFLPLPCLFLSW